MNLVGLKKWQKLTSTVNIVQYNSIKHIKRYVKKTFKMKIIRNFKYLIINIFLRFLNIHLNVKADKK